MSLYAVKNDDDKLFVVRSNDSDYLYQDQYGNPGRMLYRYCSRKDAQRAIERAGHVNQYHVVELVEAPAKVVVSAAEAEMLEKSIVEYPAKIIHRYVYDSHNFSEWDYDSEIRLMRAYVNGYTLANENRYLVYLDGLVTTDGAKQYLTNKDGKWFASRIMPGLHQDFTEDELKTAPEWAQKLDRMEVTDDGQ